MRSNHQIGLLCDQHSDASIAFSLGIRLHYHLAGSSNSWKSVLHLWPHAPLQDFPLLHQLIDMLISWIHLYHGSHHVQCMPLYVFTTSIHIIKSKLLCFKCISHHLSHTDEEIPIPPWITFHLLSPFTSKILWDEILSTMNSF